MWPCRPHLRIGPRAVKHLQVRDPGPTSRRGGYMGTRVPQAHCMTWRGELLPANTLTAVTVPCIQVHGMMGTFLCPRKWGRMERPEPTCMTLGLTQASRAPHTIQVLCGQQGAVPGHQLYTCGDCLAPDHSSEDSIRTVQRPVPLPLWAGVQCFWLWEKLLFFITRMAPPPSSRLVVSCLPSTPQNSEGQLQPQPASPAPCPLPTCFILPISTNNTNFLLGLRPKPASHPNIQPNIIVLFSPPHPKFTPNPASPYLQDHHPGLSHHCPHPP